MEEHDNNSVGDIFDAFDGQNDEIEISSASETEEQLRDEIIDGNAKEDENKTDNFQSEFIDNLSPQEPEKPPEPPLNSESQFIAAFSGTVVYRTVSEYPGLTCTAWVSSTICALESTVTIQSA